MKYGATLDQSIQEYVNNWLQINVPVLLEKAMNQILTYNASIISTTSSVESSTQSEYPTNYPTLPPGGLRFISY